MLTVVEVTRYPLLLMHSELLSTEYQVCTTPFTWEKWFSHITYISLSAEGKEWFMLKVMKLLHDLPGCLFGNDVWKCISLTYSGLHASTHWCCSHNCLQIQIRETTSAQGCIKNHKSQIPFNQVQCFGFSAHPEQALHSLLRETSWIWHFECHKHLCLNV